MSFRNKKKLAVLWPFFTPKAVPNFIPVEIIDELSFAESHEFPSSKRLTDEDFFRASDFMVGRDVYILKRRSTDLRA